MLGLLWQWALWCFDGCTRVMTAERGLLQLCQLYTHRDIRSACPHPSFFCPPAPNSPMNHTFLLHRPSVYDTPSFEDAWDRLCTWMCTVHVSVESVQNHKCLSTIKVFYAAQIGCTWAGTTGAYICMTAVFALLKTEQIQLKSRQRGRVHESHGWKRKLWVTAKLVMGSFL